MKKISKLLSILSALVMGATVCLTACGSGEAAEHDHVWNSGEITTEPTCHSEGLKTYRCTVEGCTQTKTEPVGKTAHNWDDGTVTTPAKCDAEGEKTYKCQNEGCTETRKEPIDKIPHEWETEGTVTVVPDFYTPGAKVLGCKNCTATKTVNIPAGADFGLQFREDGDGEWSYGSTAEFDGTTGAFVFTPAEYDGESKAWKADGIEITKGAVNIPGGKTAVISYTFKTEVREKIEAFAEISFMDGVKAYLVSTVGGDKSVEELNGGKFTSDNVAVQKGDQFALVLKNEGTSAVAGGLSFTVEAPCVHVWSNEGTVTTPATCTTMGAHTYKCINCTAEIVKEDIPMTGHKLKSSIERPTLTQDGKLHTECEVCHGEDTKSDETLPKQENFAYDFEINDNGEFNGWQVGKVNYTFEGNEPFEFTKIQEHSAEAYTDNTNEQWKEIKNNWMAVNGMMGFAYTFPAGTPAKVNFHFDLNAVTDGEFTIRWAIKAKDGTVKNEGGKPQFVNDANRSSYYFVERIEVAADDTLYVLVNHEGKGDQCTFNLALTPYVAFEGANFAADFTTDPGGNWLYGYATGYNEDTNAFTFHTDLTANAGEGQWNTSDNKIKIKSDYFESDGDRMVAIGYKMGQGQVARSVVVKFNGSDSSEANPRYVIRVVVKDSKGNVKSCKIDDSGVNNATWSCTDNDVIIEGGDTVYVVFFHKDGWQQGKFELQILPEAAQQPAGPTETEIANFAEDFELTDDGLFNGWEVGTVHFHFPDQDPDHPETFDFTKITGHNTGNDGYFLADPETEIKAGSLKANGMIGLAYHFSAADKVTIKFTINGAENSKWSIRWGLKDSNGTIKTNDGKASWGGDGKDVTLTQTLDVAAGDVFYVLVNKESEETGATFTYTIEGSSNTL